MTFQDMARSWGFTHMYYQQDKNAYIVEDTEGRRYRLDYWKFARHYNIHMSISKEDFVACLTDTYLGEFDDLLKL